MRRIVLVIGWMLGMCSLQAQQDILYTQFAYDKLGFNAGYSGAYDHISLTAIYRNQWLGLEGAPKRFSASLNFPALDDRLGLGLHFDNSVISVFKKSTIRGSYSYKVPIEIGTFSLGLATSFRQFVADYSDPRLVPLEGWASDDAIDPNRFTRTIFNIGLGLYYSNENYFVGASIPRLSKANIDFDEIDDLQGSEARHIYLMGGGKWSINSNWEISPQALFVIPEDNPIKLELSVLGILLKKYHMGFNYSSGGIQAIESMDLILAWQYSNQVLIGLSYDITLSELRQYSSGTIELVANYRFKKNKEANIIINPRYY